MAAVARHPHKDDKTPTMVELVDDEPNSKSKSLDTDFSALSEADQEFYRKYGRLPDRAAIVKRSEQNKSLFDSADYFMAAEKAKAEAGAHHPVSQKLPPHLRKKALPPHLRSEC